MYETVCRDTPLWLDPPWSTDVIYECNRVIEMLARSQPDSIRPDEQLPHEFLPLGMSQRFFWPDPVRTPWKLTFGIDHCHLFSLHAPMRVVAS